MNFKKLVAPICTLAVGAGSVVGYQEVEDRKERDFIVAESLVENPNKREFKRLPEQAKGYGRIVDIDGHVAHVKSSRRDMRGKRPGRDLIVEEVIDFSIPKPQFLSGCSRDERPLPEPVPIEHQPEQVVDWGIQRVNALAAQEASDAGEIIVCVLDTGIDKGHADLIYSYGRNFTSTNRSDYQDWQGHGTHVAGIVAAQNNHYGVVGASQAQLIVGKVLGNDGSGSNGNIASGVKWCVDEGAHIINLSLGGPFLSRVLEDALLYATSRGVYVFAASGNDGSDRVGYPAGFVMDRLFSVSATDMNDSLAWFSNYGKVELACPGVNILSTIPGGRYDRFSGTSMASPLCAGLFAIYLSTGQAPRFETLGSQSHFGAGLLVW